MKLRSSILSRLWLALWLLFAALPGVAQPDFYLHKNDRVVFYGDSITQQYQYASFVETYVTSRYPDLNVRFINAGWSGDWVVGGGGGTADERLARDVIGNQATVATFMVGMNDAAYQKFDPAFFDVYTKGYQHLLDVLQQASPNLRITLLQPSPFDDYSRPPEFEGGYNAVVTRYGQLVAELAKQRNALAVDFNSAVVSALQKADAIDPWLAKTIIPDRIHPAAAGGLVMAAALLQAWNAPAIVTSVEVDARRGRLESSQGTEVREFESVPRLCWTQIDGALPLPIDFEDPAMSLAVLSSNVIETLDQQILKVTGLPGGDYSLKIDGAEIATLSDEQLAQGTNLAVLPTPMLGQAQAVQKLTMRRNHVRLALWQDVQFGLQQESSPHLADAVHALSALEDELLAQQQQAATPRLHHYEIVPRKDH